MRTLLLALTAATLLGCDEDAPQKGDTCNSDNDCGFFLVCHIRNVNEPGFCSETTYSGEVDTGAPE